MAVVGSAQIVRDAWGASGAWGGNLGFVVTYEVIVDSIDDGPQIVDAAPGLPRNGDIYSAGNDTDSSSFCMSKSFQRRDETVWRVVCNYGPLTIDSPTSKFSTGTGRDKYGVPTDDPLDELVPFRTGQYTRQIPVEKAKNVQRLGHRMEMTDGPVTNSAGVVFDPPPEMDYSILVVYASARSAGYIEGMIPTFFNVVNSDNFRLKRADFDMILEPFTCRCVDIGVSLNLRNNILYWQYDFALAIDTYFTWRPEILDRGFEARAAVGDPDGRGSTILPGTIDDWKPKVRTLTDMNGHPLQTPILLNGLGQPLPDDDDPVYLRWVYYPEESYLNIEIVLGLSD